MTRTKFPRDENGEALRSMEESGDDLSKSRVIDFSVVFEDVENARAFRDQIQNPETKVVIDDDTSERVDVTVSREMTPTHDAISDFEMMLERIASPLGGRNDGWGCFAVK